VSLTLPSRPRHWDIVSAGNNSPEKNGGERKYRESMKSRKKKKKKVGQNPLASENDKKKEARRGGSGSYGSGRQGRLAPSRRSREQKKCGWFYYN